jgi:dimethylamine corrinoid protein
MSEEKNILQKLEDNVSSKDIECLSSTIREIDLKNYKPDDILNALSRGIEKAREYFRDGSFSIPDFLLAIDAYRTGTAYLKDVAPNEILTKQEGGKRRIVIGVVEGDVHDLGKNIVTAVLEACRYQVYDLGRNVPNEAFLEALNSTKAGILALSAMMSTPLANMRTLIKMVRTMYPNVAIIVGGAPFNEDLAIRIGADGYAENAVTVPDETKRLLDYYSSGKKLITNEL